MTDPILPNRVLFIDDDRSMRVAFANAAHALGIEATVAESGGKALELAQPGEFPVVVTDLHMPGIDGIELIERLSARDRSTAFVLVSADPELRNRQSAPADGAIAAFLGKPLDMTELQDTLAHAFALHQRRLARRKRSTPPKGWSLLIVEDTPGDADLLHEYLSGQPGLEVVHVSRLQDALRLVHDREFDSIITDLSLPDARGFDSVLRLQASAPNAAILAYSGVEDEALALQIVQLGAQDFLRKGATDRDSLLRSLRFARERKRGELRLRRLAHYDQLTGLANRASFNEALQQARARATRQKQPLAVMMIDLDGFKAINDGLGHEAGDQVLQEVGVRLRCLFREYDAVARFGGDEFAVLLTDFVSKDALNELGLRLLASLAEPIGQHGLSVTGSVGIATFPEAGKSAASLLRSADMAMYKAKRAGRNRAVLFDGPAPYSSNPAMHAGASGLPPQAALKPPRLPSDVVDCEDRFSGVVAARAAPSSHS